MGGDPELHFTSIRQRSGHSALRVVLETHDPLEDLLAPLRDLGCQAVPTERQGVFGLDVPREADITCVLDYLSELQEAGKGDWDVGSISAPHGAALREMMGGEPWPDWVPRP